MKENIAAWLRPATWPRRILLALVILEVVYLIAGNGFLNTELGKGLINRKPEKLTVVWQGAFTVLPGLVHIEGLELEGHSHRVVWRATIDRGSALIWLPSLLNKHFRLIGGKEVGVEADIDLLPKPDTAKPKKKRRGWRVTLGGLRVDELRRLRVDDYELDILAQVRGWARFQVRGPMELHLDRLAFEDGTVTSSGREVASQFDLDAAFLTEPWRVGEQPLSELLASTDGGVDLRTHAENLAFLAAYLGKVPWLGLGGSGDLELDLEIEQGLVLPGGTMSLEGPAVRADFFDFRANGAGRVEGAVTSTEDGIELGAVLATFSVERQSDGAQVFSGENLVTRVKTRTTALYEKPDGLVGSIRLPPSKIEDLAVFARYVPAGTQLEVTGGTADISVELDYDTFVRGGTGQIKLAASDLSGSFGDASMVANATLDVQIPDLDIYAGRYDVSTTSVTIDSARFEQAGKVRGENWWGRVELPRALVEMRPREPSAVEPPPDPDSAWSRLAAKRREGPSEVALVADLEVEMLDTGPVVILMEQRLPKLRFIEGLLTVPEVQLQGTVGVQGAGLSLDRIEVTGGKKDQLSILLDLDLEGKDKTSGVAYARWRAVDGALSLQEGDRNWHLIKAKQKYEAAIAEYRDSRPPGPQVEAPRMTSLEGLTESADEGAPDVEVESDVQVASVPPSQ